MKIRLHVLPVLLLICSLAAHPVQAAPLLRAATSSVADAQARIETITAEDPIFADDFTRNTGAWSTKSDDKDLTYTYKDRAFHLRIGKDNSTVWRTNTKINELKLTNFYLEADAAQVEGPPDGEFGLVFHEVNSDNFYLFAIRQAGAYSLWKHVDQEWEALVDWTDTDAVRTAKKATNKLGLLVEENEITLLVNDEVLTQLYDDTFGQGMIGLAAGTVDQGGLEVSFDNVSLWSLYQESPDLPDHLQDIMGSEPAFTDNFQRDEGHWTNKADDPDVSFTYKNRALHIRVDRQKWTAWTFNEQIDDLKLSDFYLEAEASQVDGPQGAEFGLVFRQVDKDNFYLYSISREGTYSLWKQVDSKWRPIVDWTTTDALQTDAEAVNKLGILAEGAQITLLLNDQVLFQLQDNSFQTGTVGLLTGTYDDSGAEVAFTKLAIWPLKSAEENTPTAEVTETSTPEATPTADNVQAHIETITQAEQAFSDDFRRDDGYWKTKSTDKAVTFAYANRALHIRIDKKNWLTWTFNQQIDALNLSDFYLESDVAAVGAPDDAQFGVVFRFVDNKNFYKFAISRSGTYSLVKSVDDEWETIVDWTKADAIQIDPKAKNKLGLLVEGDQIALLVNDELLTQVTDDTFMTGTVGLLAGAYNTSGVEVAFDKLDIWSLNANAEETATPEAQTPTDTEPTDTPTPEATETSAETETSTPEATITDEATSAETPEETATAEATATEEATATDTPAATPTPGAKGTPTTTANGASAPIKLQAFTAQSFSAYKLRMEMKLDGQAGEQAMKGNLIIETSKNVGKNQSRVLIDGTLVKDFISKQMKLPGMEIETMTVFKTGEDLLVLVTGNLNTCFKATPNDERFSSLDKITEFGQLIDTIAGNDSKLRGVLVGKEIINGLQTQHYTIDVEAMNAANSNSSATDHMESGAIWVALNGQYPVRLHAAGPTEIGSFLDDKDFAGHMDITFDVSDVNVPLNLALPAACQRPITIP